jgi:hypothetical protein
MGGECSPGRLAQITVKACTWAAKVRDTGVDGWNTNIPLSLPNIFGAILLPAPQRRRKRTLHDLTIAAGHMSAPH